MRRIFANKPSRAALPYVIGCSLALASLCAAFGLQGEGGAPEDAPVLPVVMEEPAQEEPEGPEQALRGSYTAHSQSADGARLVNMRLACESLDGTVVGPGETLSMNGVLGDTINDERYLMAPIVEGGRLVDGRGGGICQVSTALYLAALEAGMGIVERHPHSLAIDYAPLGLDATLSYGTLDLVVRNDADGPVTVQARSEGQTCTVEVWGDPPDPGRTVEAVSTIVDIGSREGLDGGEVAVYTAESYLVVYRDGTAVESRALSTDVYLESPGVAVRTSEGATEAAK